MITEKDKIRFNIAAIVISIMLVIWGIYSLVNYRKYTHATVTETNWYLEIGLQQFQIVHDSGWSHPYDAYNVGRTWKYRTDESYISGYKTVTVKGSSYNCGTTKNPRTCYHPDTTKQEAIYSTRPVYDWWYEYDMNRWVNIPPLFTEGTSKETVEWPDASNYPTEAPDQLGNIKQGLPLSHFWIILVDTDKKTAGKVYSVDMDINEWKTHYKGRKTRITMGFFNNILKVE